MTDNEREDALAVARIQEIKTYSIKALIDAGFEANSAVRAVTTNDLTQLKAAPPRDALLDARIREGLVAALSA